MISRPCLFYQDTSLQFSLQEPSETPSGSPLDPISPPDFNPNFSPLNEPNASEPATEPQEELSYSPIDNPISGEPSSNGPPDPPINICAGIAPVLRNSSSGQVVAPCWNGYWVIDSNMTLNATNYNIEGRIEIRGDFTVEMTGSLLWSGFASTNDSRPDIPLSPDGIHRSYLLSFINVTGTVDVKGAINVAISETQMEAIVGRTGGKRSGSQLILEASHMISPVKLTLPSSTATCRKIEAATGVVPAPSGRSSLLMTLTLDDSACVNKKKINIAAIVASCVVVGVLLIIGGFVLAAFKIPALRRRVLPFTHARMTSERQSGKN